MTNTRFYIAFFLWIVVAVCFNGRLIEATGGMVTSLYGGAANQLVYQSGANTTAFGGSIIQSGQYLSSTSVNLNAASITPLYTVPSSRKAVITNIIIQQLSGTCNNAEMEIGWAGATSNIAANVPCSRQNPTSAKALILGISDADDVANYMVSNPTIGTAGQALNFNVTTPQGSALTAVVNVFGYLTDTSGVPVAN